MKKISFIAALIVAMTAVSCVKENAPVVSADGPVAFTAEFSEAATKAVLKPGEASSKVEWLAGDQVTVFAGESNHMYTAASAGASTSLTTTETVTPAENYYAVYPYNAEATVAEGVITTVLPAQQVAVEGSFATHLAVAQTSTNSLAFKNVCGLVKVNVSSDNVTSVVFEGNSGEVVAGSINVTVADAPSWAAVAEQGATSVTLLPADGQTTIAAGDYYFAVLPQTFAAGFKVTSNKNDGHAVVRNVEGEVTVARSGMVAGKSFGISGKGTEAEPYILMTAQDMVDMRSLATLGGETWFKMGADIDMTGITNYVPVNHDQDFERKIHFDGDNHTLSNFASDRDDFNGNYPSLFGVLYGSCKNLVIDAPEIKATGVAGVVAGYVGTTDKPGLVENVTITNATINSTGERAAGICGHAKEATFKNVSFQGTVTTTGTSKESKSGGFVGQTEASTFEDCTVDVTLKGAHNDLGGFAGKVSGTVSFTDCDVKVILESSAAANNRAGGFIGWNASAKTTITNCHVLEGSSIKDTSSKTAKTNSVLGGFIGFGDTAGTVLDITNCSANATVDAGSFGIINSCFIGRIGYASTVTIKNSFAKGSVTSSYNYSGGLVGNSSTNCVLTITGCYFDGTVAGSSGVGGFVGGFDTGDKAGSVTINKSYALGTVNAASNNSGGIVGLTTGATTVENCWTDITVNGKGQFGGGLVGGAQAALTIKNCYSLGDAIVTRGTGGILGQIKNVAPVVEGCIAWGNITSSRTTGHYSVGAIVGNIQVDGKYAKCYRNPSMVLTDVAMTLIDHEDVESGRPPLPTYEGATADNNQYAYHGKAAAADATISSIAKSLGWDEDVWDLSGDVPALK